VKVPRNYLLPIKFIAKLWAGELQGTPLEEPVDVLEKLLIDAFTDEELPPAAGSEAEELLEDMREIFFNKRMPTPRAGREPIDTELWIGPVLWSAIPETRISRIAFLWWLVNGPGYPPPTFWDGDEIVDPETVEQLTDGFPGLESRDLMSPGLLKKHKAAPTGDSAPHHAAKKRGRQPLVMERAVSALREAIKADPCLRNILTDKTEKELQRLCGNVSRETARKALVTVLRDPK
jgi:hypothetical protein